jgi:Uma2 family endonuclease
MAVTRGRVTLAEFLTLPEEKPYLELAPDGTITQKMWPKGRHSTLQGALLQIVNAVAQPRRIAWAFPELRAIFGGAAYVPDVSVYRWHRIPRTSEGVVADDFTIAPDIVFEIVSPRQSRKALIRRCVWYVENGVAVAALVDPADESVLMLRLGAQPPALRGADPIELDDVVPGLSFTVEKLFEALRG